MLQDPFASPTLSRGLAWWFMSHAAERMLWYYWSFMAPFKTPELCPANGHLLLWRTIMFTLHKVLDRSGSFSQNKKYKAMQSSAEKSTASEHYRWNTHTTYKETKAGKFSGGREHKEPSNQNWPIKQVSVYSTATALTRTQKEKLSLLLACPLLFSLDWSWRRPSQRSKPRTKQLP